MLENSVIQCTYFEYYIQCKEKVFNKILVISTAAIYNMCQLVIIVATRQNSLFVGVCSATPTSDYWEMAKGDEAATATVTLKQNDVLELVLCC